ncbi:MAG: hypothetical protein LUB61_06610, partial [Eggerthellaceae bacterium]|nr:hypothetical protein [Eggerthellaceae bacterium]
NALLVKNDPTPVILVTATEHEAPFREVCTFKTLLPEAIRKDPVSLTGKELRDDAVAILEADRRAKLEKVIDTFDYDLSKGKASDNLPDIAFALVERKVQAFFVQEGKGIPGTFDKTNGNVYFDGDPDPVDDKLIDPASPDLTDALAQAALAQGARIYVLPAAEMPGNRGVAAIYRY